MDVRRVSGRTAAPAGPGGISAQLADARSRLRRVVPAGAEDAVQEEVQRIRDERGVSLLVALQLVYERLAAGWVPVRRR